MSLVRFTYLGLALLALGQVFSLVNGAPADATELFLTPLITAGDLAKAKAAAMDSTKLSNVKTDREVKSYSGYLTIDEAKESNLFFWFFPAQENPENAPVILWINEAPGFSCLKGIFLETGPFEVDDNNALVERNHTWTKSHSMLYIDAPVGTGFSYAKDESAYANTSEEEATEVVEALKQFFTLFSEFKDRDFYMAGESYASITLPYIAKRLEADGGGIKLKGFVIGSPFISLEQSFREDGYYEMGLLDEKQRDEFHQKTQDVIDLIKAGKPKEAQQAGFSLLFGPDSLLNKYTGVSDPRSALSSRPPGEIAKFEKWLDSKEVHNYLHVGLHKFIEVNAVVVQHFVDDFTHSHDKIIEELLDKGYRVLFYAPLYDMFLTRRGITEAIGKLKWKGADKFAAAPRKVWKVKEDVAGYVKTADNFSFVVLRNAGNFAIMDQPEWTLDLVEKFLYNKEI